jgi:hypothetical protein
VAISSPEGASSPPPLAPAAHRAPTPERASSPPPLAAAAPKTPSAERASSPPPLAPTAINITEPAPAPSGHPPSAPAFLDPSGYPHIFDEIFAHVSDGDLLSLRRVCTDFRDRADPKRTRHLFVTPTTTRSAIGALLHVDRVNYSPKTEVVDCFDRTNLPSAPGTPADAGWGIRFFRELREWEGGAYHMLLALVRFGWTESPFPLPSSQWALRNKHLFFPDPIYEHISELCEIYDPSSGAMILDAHYPVGKMTFVFSAPLECPPSTPIYHEWYRIEDLVFIFLTDELGYDGERELLSTMFCFPGEGYREYTFVNSASLKLLPDGPVHEFTARYAPREDASMFSTLQEHFALINYHESTEPPQHFQISDRYLTLEEYEAKVGTKTFKLETDPSYVLV